MKVDTQQVQSTSAEDTKRIGEAIGTRLKGGEVIELVSDLGGGKTTFVHGLAKGIGSTDHVASPTFTISKLYKGSRLELYHFDFYRLQDAGLMQYELHDILDQPRTVLAVEWADVAAHVLPDERLAITFKRTGDESRTLEITYPEELAYVVEGIQ